MVSTRVLATANAGNDNTICQNATVIGSIFLTALALITRRNPSSAALAVVTHMPMDNQSVFIASCGFNSVRHTPMKASTRPVVPITLKRSLAIRKCAKIAANIGLVDISTDAMMPLELSIPIFISPICTVNKALIHNSVGHCARDGHKLSCLNFAHSKRTTTPSTKRINALANGGKTANPNLAAMGLPPQSV